MGKPIERMFEDLEERNAGRDLDRKGGRNELGHFSDSEGYEHKEI